MWFEVAGPAEVAAWFEFAGPVAVVVVVTGLSVGALGEVAERSDALGATDTLVERIVLTPAGLVSEL